MTDEKKRSGLIVLVAIALGLALGAWLAVWVLRSGAGPVRGEPAVELGSPEGETGFGVLQFLQAGALEAPLRVRPAGADGFAGYPRILLVAVPHFGPRGRAFLFVRPAASELCRSFEGIELATFWYGSEPVALCAVGDPPRDRSVGAAVELPPLRSS